MFEVKITIEAKDLACAIEKLADAIGGRALPIPEAKVAEATPEQMPEPAPIPEPTPTPAPIPEPTPAPMPAPAPVIDLDTISRAGAGLVDQGKMAEIMAVLKKYNVMAITQLTPEQFPAFAADLRALGANI